MWYKNSTDHKFLLSGFLVTFLEFFDYGLSMAAMNIMSAYFLPNHDYFTIIFGWVAVSVSCFVRPLGAIFFGHIGDKFGCKKALTISIILMSFSTIMIGCIPGYQAIGYWAPAIIIILRILQGFAISAEYNGIGVYLSQKSYLKSKLGLYCAVTPIGAYFAFIVSTFLFQYTFDAAWRSLFIASGIIVGFAGLWLRLSMNTGLSSRQVKIPLLTLLQTQKKAIGVFALLSGLPSLLGFICLTYCPSYLQMQYGFSHEDAYQISLSFNLVVIPCIILSAWLSDKFSRLAVLKFTFIALTISTLVFCLYPTTNLVVLFLKIGVLNVFTGFSCGPLPAMLAESFLPEQRYTGSALGYNLGVALLGGTTPFGLLLLNQYLDKGLVMMVYPAILAIVAFLVLSWSGMQRASVSNNLRIKSDLLRA